MRINNKQRGDNDFLLLPHLFIPSLCVTVSKMKFTRSRVSFRLFNQISIDSSSITNRYLVSLARRCRNALSPMFPRYAAVAHPPMPAIILACFIRYWTVARKTRAARELSTRALSRSRIAAPCHAAPRRSTRTRQVRCGRRVQGCAIRAPVV